ncbi:MAG: hypothetical protein ACFFD9_05320 [Candidatus Thorarchaeota archaeon]
MKRATGSHEATRLRLTSDSFSRACDFIRKNARDVDRALFEYHFENGQADEVLGELVKYQNSDGGFGNAIEPDLRLRASSPFATSVGLQYCMEIGLGEESSVIESAMEYLVSTYDTEHNYWTYTFMDVNEEPHAPWWHLEEIAPPKESSWPNPSAELFGYCHRYANLIPDNLLRQMNQRALTNLESSETIEGLYNVMCWERAYESIPEPLKSKAMEKLERTFREIVPLTQETLGEIRVFWLSPSIDSILARTHPDNVYHLLDLEIQKQAEDGGWWPTWKWGQFEDVWPIAEKEWAGRITLNCLKALKRFDLNKAYLP